MHVAPQTDRNALRAFFSQDRRLTAYALGDLDDAFWPQSAFFGAEGDAGLDAVLLVYQGFDPPVLTGYGSEAGIAALFAGVDLPEEVYYLLPAELGGVLTGYYTRPQTHREWRMVLDPPLATLPPLDGVHRVAPEQADELTDLYRLAAGPGEAVVAFDPWQIAQGVFFGAWESGELVATAGTHVWSQTERVAAIGNVFTRPDRRGRGHATRCTAAVAAQALAAGIDTIVLNVREDNAPAIRVYEKLGFRRYALFWEGPGLSRNRG